MKFSRVIGAAVLGWAGAAAVRAEPAQAAQAPPSVSFSREVKPILARRCFACHGAAKQEGGLRLDVRDGALGELDSGARAIVPGDRRASVLWERVAAEDETLRMPPEGAPLAPRELDVLGRWLDQGAVYEKHWAFAAPVRQAPPASHAASASEHPIDAFIAKRLVGAGLKPAPHADRRVLARRAYFDLLGLPPTPEQVAEFVTDERVDAWPRLVDRLLASPQYGERWARHWLDVVRFAETNSFERDGLKPYAWKFRDYVIRSLNDDKPYDEFVREQLAGDELDEVTPDSIIATGYYRLGVWDDEPADPEQARYDEWDDIVSTTGQAFLGLTIGCARCHDHKIDPIPQADYYGMLAFFADVTPYAYPTQRDPMQNSLWDMSPAEDRARRQALAMRELTVREELTAIEGTGIRRMTAEDQRVSEGPDRAALLANKLEGALNASEWQQYRAAQRRLQDIEREVRELPALDAALALARCEPRPAATRIMLRGNPHVPGDVVQPHFPTLFGAAAPEIPDADPAAHSAGRRRVLAQWIADAENPLTARVVVNRVWQHHFGRGLVRTPNNFGELGAPPTHPELLDWLALWLVDHRWQLKPLHRLIMTSGAYQMSSTPSARAAADDPTNDMLSHFDMRRLDAEEIRDATLAVAGQLNLQAYGPGVFEKMSAEALATQSRPGDGWGESPEAQQRRRSIYIHVKRSLVPPLLTAFDFPDVDSSCEARFVTIQPGQALAMINGPFFAEQADRLAERVAREAGDDAGAQAARALELALGRPADAEEIAAGLDLMQRLTAEHGLDMHAALSFYCLTVLNLNEFVYLD